MAGEHFAAIAVVNEYLSRRRGHAMSQSAATGEKTQNFSNSCLRLARLGSSKSNVSDRLENKIENVSSG